MKYNQEVIEAASSLLECYGCGKKVFCGTLAQIRLGADLYVDLGWLSEPVIEYKSKVLDLCTALDELPQEIAFEVVGDMITIWQRQFSNKLVYLLGGDWARNHDALETIFHSVEEGHEFNVYVPMFDTNFTNEYPDEADDDEEMEDLDLADCIDAFAALLRVMGYYCQQESRHVLGQKSSEEKKATKAAEAVMDLTARRNVELEDRLERDLAELKKKEYDRYKLDIDGNTIKIDHVHDEWLIKLPDQPAWMTRQVFDDYVRSRAEGGLSPSVSWSHLDMVARALRTL